VEDAVGNLASLTPASITLDQTPPTTPATFTRSVSCLGADRTIVLNWGLSSDTHLRGYRIYRDAGSGFAELGATSNLTFTDVHKKNVNTMRYQVVGYDKAGNESDATDIIALSKNQCS
jgi:hypothetical protein